jgi:hypothetical protein
MALAPGPHCTPASPRRPGAIWARTLAVPPSYRNRPNTASELRVCRVNGLVGVLGYRAVSVTRKRKDGRTEWIPPPHLDSGQSRVNDYHHPENYLLPEEDDEPTAD